MPVSGQRGRLPGHGRGDLAVHEPDHLEQPDLAPAARHTDDQQVEQSGGPEYRQHGAEDEREVDCLPEVDERGGGDREGGERPVPVEIAVDCRLSARARHEGGQHPAVGRPRHFLSAGGSRRTRRAGGVLVARQREHRSATQRDGVADHRERHLTDYSERRRPLAPGRQRHCDVDDRADPGAHSTHGRPAETHLSPGVGRVAVNRQEEERSPDGPFRPGPRPQSCRS